MADLFTDPAALDRWLTGTPAEASKEYEAQTARFRAIARAIKLSPQ